MATRTHQNRFPVGTSAVPRTKPLPARGLMKERAYHEIRKRILDGEFPSSTFLSERQMAGELAMSKTPVRAALERLELEGFVTISPQQGIIVRDLSVHAIADLYEMRAVLETFILRTVAGSLCAAQIAAVQTNLKTQKEALPSGDIPLAVRLDAEFHMLFCTFLGNQEMLRVMGQLRDRIFRVISRVFHINPGRIASSYTEHRSIAEAVINGDGVQAAKLIVEHLNRGKRHLIAPRG